MQTPAEIRGRLRDAAAAAFARDATEQAGRTTPVLHRFEQRDRGAEVAHVYLERLQAVHGTTQTWEGLRKSTDRDLRRSAYRHSIDGSLLDVDDAISLLPRERDQVVRRSLAHVVAEHGQPPAIREVLLRGRSAEGRVLGLVRLQAPSLTNDDVFPLLAPIAAPEDVPETLTLVRSPNSRVARLAVDVLAANLGLWSRADASDLSDDPDPEIRRRGWLLRRSRGGWESLISDLEILGDPDGELARLGARPTAPMYLPPSDEQRARIGQLLPDATLKRDLKLGIAFAAGRTDLTAELRSQPRRPRPPVEAETTTKGSSSWWRKLFGWRPSPGKKA